MEVGLRELLAVGAFIGSVVAAWVTVKVNMATLTQRINDLEKDLDAHGAWKEKLVDTLKDFSVVLGKVEIKLENMDKNISNLEGKLEEREP